MHLEVLGNYGLRRLQRRMIAMLVECNSDDRKSDDAKNRYPGRVPWLCDAG